MSRFKDLEKQVADLKKEIEELRAQVLTLALRPVSLPVYTPNFPPATPSVLPLKIGPVPDWTPSRPYIGDPPGWPNSGSTITCKSTAMNNT